MQWDGNDVNKLGRGGTCLYPALGKQEQEKFCKFEASLTYRASPGQPSLQKETLSRKTKKQNKQKDVNTDLILKKKIKFKENKRGRNELN